MDGASRDVSMDGRVLRSVSTGGDGEVDADTRFYFSQEGDLVHARYEGGAIRLGFLVGINSGRELRFRYCQVDADGRTATGRSTDRIEVFDDGRVRLHEEWSWDSREGTGTSVLEEVPEPSA